MFAYRMTDSEVDLIIKNVQTIEKTTDPASNLSLAERPRLNLSWPEIGHFRCRTYGTAVPSSAGGGVLRGWERWVLRWCGQVA